MRTRKILIVGAAALATIALTLTTGTASADPNGAPTFRDLAGSGSDTTQGVLNGLSDVVTISGTKVVGSYDAATTPTQTMSTKSTPACTNIARPSGSGAGVTALINSQAAGDGCLQFARSSANDAPARAGANLTYIPFAVDAVSYAVRSDSPLSKKFTLAQLTTIYNCGAGANFAPLLPQFGSGTRKFFLSLLGFTDSATFTSQPGHTCISQVDATGNPLLENTGTLITDPKNIAPYSVAQYLSQTNGVVADVHGQTVLGSINSLSPAVLNTASAGVRDVYNVVPNSQTAAGTETNQVFVGSTSLVCSNAVTIQRFGFGTNPNCGSTAIKTP